MLFAKKRSSTLTCDLTAFLRQIFVMFLLSGCSIEEGCLTEMAKFSRGWKSTPILSVLPAVANSFAIPFLSSVKVTLWFKTLRTLVV